MILWVLVFILMAGSAEAATLYVNNSGSPACDDDTVKASNSAGSPWCTIARAAAGDADPTTPSSAQAASAGDIVLVTAGTYTELGTRTAATGCGGGGRWEVALNPANSGTSGNLIIFRAVGTVLVLLDSDYVGPTLGTNGRDYIQWEGFSLNDATAGDNSCYDGGLITIHESVGSVVLGNTITGTTKSTGSADANNYSGIRLEATTNTIVRNNTISNFATTGTFSCGSNCTGLTLYENEDAIIEHNDISAMSTGIYVKGDAAGDGWPQINNIIRFNRIHDLTGHGIGLYAANGTQIYQNIIKDVNHGIHIYDIVSPNNDNLTIQNNVIVSGNQSTDAGVWYPDSTADIVALRFFNNIVYGSWSYALNFGGASLGDQSFEHNVYNGYDTFAAYSGSNRTFAYWQGTVGEDSASPAGITDDPLFVNETDYKLQAGSPARDLGVDILNLAGGGTSGVVHAGAYITGSETIGVESGTVASTTIGGGSTFSGSVRIQ